MNDAEKTRDQLLDDLARLQERIAQLEEAEKKNRLTVAELRRSTQLSDALNRIAPAMYSKPNSGEIISELITAGSAALGSDTAAISLRENGGWIVRHIFGMPQEMVGLHMTDDQELHAVLAVKTREPVTVSDAFNDKRFNREHLRRHSIRSVLVLPLISRDQGLGVLFFNYHAHVHMFSEAEVDFARQLAMITATALENARLHDEQEKTAKSLRESERRLALAASNARIGMFEWHIDSNKLYFNEQLAQLLGIPFPFFAGFRSYRYGEWVEHVDPEDRPRIEAELRRCMAEHRPYETEYRIVPPGADVRWVTARGLFEYDGQNRPVCLRGITLDITPRKSIEDELRKTHDGLERIIQDRTSELAAANAALTREIADHRQTETALRDNEEKYRRLFDNALFALCVFDAETLRILDVNDTHIALYGYSREELLGGMLATDLSAEHEVSLKSIQKARTSGPERVGLRYHKRKDSTVFPVEIAVVPYDLRGRVVICGIVHDISQRLKAERALMASENRYRELFDNMRSGVAVYRALDDGHDFVCVDFNRAGERIDNDSREDLIGKRLTEVRPGVVDFGLLDVLRRVWKNGTAELYPARMYQDARLQGWYENYVYKLSSGEIVAIFDNVSDRKVAEQRLSLHAEILTKITDGVNVVSARTGQFVYNTPTFEAMFGYEPGEMIGLTPAAINAPEAERAPEETAENIIATLHQKGLWRGNLMNRRKDGSTFWTDVTITSHEISPWGRVWLGIQRDITERILAERALGESERKYRRLFEVESDALFLVEAKTLKILDVNPSTERLYGYSRDEFLTMRTSDISAEPQKTRSATLEKVTRVDLRRHRKKDGTIFPVEITGTYFQMEGKRVHLAAIRDITERKRIEDQLTEKSEHLAEVNAALRALLRHRDLDRKEFESTVETNMKYLVLPYLQSLKASKISDNQRNWIEILETHLNQLTSKFAKRVTLPELNFSNAELKVATLVKEGKTTKEIAETLMISAKTVAAHRDNIRKKLGLRGKKGGLRYLLLNIGR